MRLKHWIVFIALNIVVSAAVTLALLAYWESTHPSRAYEPEGMTAPTAAPVSSATPAADTAPGAAQPTPVSLAPAAPSATPRHTIYVVQRGDTLSAISRRFDVSVDELMAINGLTADAILRIGQQIAIPDSSRPLSTSTPAPSPTSPPSELAPVTRQVSVEIRQVLARGDPTREVVVIANLGRQVNLRGWKLADTGGAVYTFPDLTLWPGGTITVHTGSGPDSVSDLYWKRVAPVWAEPGDVVTLTDAEGNVVARYALP